MGRDLKVKIIEANNVFHIYIMIPCWMTVGVGQEGLPDQSRARISVIRRSIYGEKNPNIRLIGDFFFWLGKRDFIEEKEAYK